MRRQMRTWGTMLAIVTLVVGATTVVHGQDQSPEAGAVQAADGEAATATNPRCRSWGSQVPEGSAGDAELRGVCPLPQWDNWSEDWPFKQKLRRAFYAPGVDSGATPQTQIMGLGFALVGFPKGGARKAVRDAVKSGQLKSDDVVVLGKPNKQGPYRVYRVDTAEMPGARDGGALSIHVAGDLNGDRTDNVATSVDQPSHPFQGTQVVASLVFANGELAAYYTDFAQNGGGFYNLTDEVDMVAWVDSDGVWFVVPAEWAPDAFRALTFAAGAEDQPGSLRGDIDNPKSLFLDGSASADLESTIYHFRLEQEVSGITMNGEAIHPVKSENLGLNTLCGPKSADEQQALQRLNSFIEEPVEPPLSIHITWLENDNKLELLTPGYIYDWVEGTRPDGAETGFCIAYVVPLFQPGSDITSRVAILDAPAGLGTLAADVAKQIEGTSVPTRSTESMSVGRAQGEKTSQEDALFSAAEYLNTADSREEEDALSFEEFRDSRRGPDYDELDICLALIFLTLGTEDGTDQ